MSPTETTHRRNDRRHRGLVPGLVLAAAGCTLVAPAVTLAQPMDPGRVDIAFNRYYDEL